MDPLTDLSNSDTIRISRLAYDLNGPSQVSPGHKDRPPICLSKTEGQLVFTLNTKKDLGVADPFDFDIDFIGQNVGMTNGLPVVQWNVDQDVHKDVQASGHAVHIGTVKGSISTAVVGLAPRQPGTACDASTRSFGVALGTAPAENKLQIHGSVNISPGIDIGFDATAENIVLAATAGETVSFKAKIMGGPDECGVIEAGSTVGFWAMVTNIPSGDTVTYSWSVSGADAAGPADQWNFHVTMPDPPTQVRVTLTASVEGITSTDSIRLIPASHELAARLRLICQINSEVRVNMFVDPLWDPLRDLVTHPLDEQELNRVRQFASNLVDHTTALLEGG